MILFKNRKTYLSKIEGFEGECYPVYINNNVFDVRTSGKVTAFFKLVKRGWFGIRYTTGVEFHGYFDGNVIRSTKGLR